MPSYRVREREIRQAMSQGDVDTTQPTYSLVDTIARSICDHEESVDGYRGTDALSQGIADALVASGWVIPSDEYL